MAVTDERLALARWAETVIAAELPIEEGRYALALAEPDADACAEVGGAAWSGAAFCDGRVVGASLRFVGTESLGDPLNPTAARYNLITRLFSVARMGDRTRAAAFVRAWAIVLRRVFQDLSRNPYPDAPWLAPSEPGRTDQHDRLLTRAETVESFVEALCGPKLYGRFFAPPAGLMRAALERVHAVVTESPPILDARGITLRALETPWNDEDPIGPFKGGVRGRHVGLVVGLELSVREDGALRDLKQQEVDMVPGASLGDLDRVEAYLRAWRDVLTEHVTLLSAGEIEALMPHDLVAPDVLSLKRARTREDFRKALAQRWHFDLRREQSPPRRAR